MLTMRYFASKTCYQHLAIDYQKLLNFFKLTHPIQGNPNTNEQVNFLYRA